MTPSCPFSSGVRVTAVLAQSDFRTDLLALSIDWYEEEKDFAVSARMELRSLKRCGPFPPYPRGLLQRTPQISWVISLEKPRLGPGEADMQ